MSQGPYVHLPCHESDHVLTLAYSVLRGGARLEDVDRLRNDVPLLNGLGARLLPDPTTRGTSCIAVTTGYAAYQTWPTVVPARATAGALSATVLIGGLAGLYPAIRAARLSPTEALATP